MTFFLTNTYGSCFSKLPLSSAEAPAGYHSKNSNNRKTESARFFLPSLPTTQRGLCGGESKAPPGSRLRLVPSRYLSVFWDERRLRIRLRCARGLMGREEGRIFSFFPSHETPRAPHYLIPNLLSSQKNT